MSNKKWITFLAAAVVVVGIILGNILSNQKTPMRKRAIGPSSKPPKIIQVKNGSIQAPVEINGYLYAYDKVELYAEVTGVLQSTPKHFREGTRYQQGEVLIHIDDTVYRNNLLSQKSSLLNQLTMLLPDLSIDFPESAKRWQEYLNRFTLQQPIEPFPVPASEKERYYIAARNIFSSFYNVKSMEATLEKYTLKAPFPGVVSESNINPGTLVRVGQKLGEFTSTQLYELEAPVGLFDLNRIKTGQDVTLTTGDIPGTFTGYIQRINSVIDRNSMTVKVYVHLNHKNLRDGMYMTGRTQGIPIENAFSIPKDLLVAQNRIFGIEKSRLVLKTVEIIGSIGDKLIIRGLVDGSLILGETWPEAREGITVPGQPPNDPVEDPQAAKTPAIQTDRLQNPGQ